MSKKRNTIQKTIVLETVKAMKNHPTAEEIYQKINQKYPSISKGTVYRNLNLLDANQEIIKFSFLDEPSRYDFRTDDHCHFKCKSCQQVFDIEVSDDFLKSFKLDHLAIDSYEITFQGLCNNCLQKKNKEE